MLCIMSSLRIGDRYMRASHPPGSLGGLASKLWPQPVGQNATFVVLMREMWLRQLALSPSLFKRNWIAPTPSHGSKSFVCTTFQESNKIAKRSIIFEPIHSNVNAIIQLLHAALGKWNGTCRNERKNIRPFWKLVRTLTKPFIPILLIEFVRTGTQAVGIIRHCHVKDNTSRCRRPISAERHRIIHRSRSASVEFPYVCCASSNNNISISTTFRI